VWLHDAEYTADHDYCIAEMLVVAVDEEDMILGTVLGSVAVADVVVDN
jgi:hypothetical protein